nr:uncharacterized protein LOC110791500 [Spinacia oleracea]
MLFVYGAPHVSDRSLVWSEISSILARYPNTVLIGDFNQVEFMDDKLGGSTVFRVNSPNPDPIPFDWGKLQLPVLSLSDKEFLMIPFFHSDIQNAIFNIFSDVRHFFAHGFMLKDRNRTFIILLRKVEHPDLVFQFRPIGLCNVIYKCIAKCITHRLRSVLSSLTSDTQNAFVPGRLMSNECLIAHELMCFINVVKARRKFYAVVKLDMNKAYDRVKWEFLFAALHAFGFPPYWINIIRQCVTTVSYQVLVNGEPTASFRPTCGLRQGDPLSPYLFVLCMEILSALLRRAEGSHRIEGIAISRGAPPISHLFFADDSLLFFKVSPEICDQVLEVLSEFSNISSQIINYQKSFVKFSPNTLQDYRDYLASSLCLGQRQTLGHYLGVLVDLGRSKCSAFYGLVDNIARRLANFSSSSLSAAAKLVVINSVLVASITHVLSVFKIPQSICDRIDSLCLRFWWRSSAGSRGMALVQSSALHLPKGMGGLGIRRISPFNQALFAKAAWRAILSIRITQDVWVSDKLISFKDSLVGLDCPTHVSSLINLRSYAWDAAVVCHFFSEATANNIMALERPLAAEEQDLMFWKLTSDGLFSVRSAYAMILRSGFITGHAQPDPPDIWWKHFWGLSILPKFKIFLWKMLHDGLPLGAKIRLRGMDVDPMCSLCHSEEEVPSHLFRDLETSVVAPFWPCSDSCSFVSWCVCFMRKLSKSSSSLHLLDVFVSSLWAIWIVRNNMCFRLAPWDPGALHVILQDLMVRCSAVHDLRRRHDGYYHVQKPSPCLQSLGGFDSGPPTDMCVISDGAWMPVSNQAGAELVACLYAVHMASRRGCLRVLVYLDSAILVHLLSSQGVPPVAVMWVVRDLRLLLSKFSWFYVMKVSRSMIQHAHDLADSARRRQLLMHRF